jgi:sulfur carrier protein ThiS
MNHNNENRKPRREPVPMTVLDLVAQQNIGREPALAMRRLINRGDIVLVEKEGEPAPSEATAVLPSHLLKAVGC